MTDLELKRSVETELNWEPSVNPAEIGVVVKDGTVTLAGNVQSYWRNGTQNALCHASTV
ncbi:MAG: BON domain-containing protein [Candidatus Acidiferrales bacterium]